ncbi:MAG TPA: tetratricopeptide repeat protein [Sunxiuqinia sp.]|nr:tetratricopeptide repeat protein [Sunxiuqinia sp.]
MGIFLMLLSPVFVQAQQLKLDVNKLQLANQYYRNKNYEKASVLYHEIYEKGGSQYYFRMYLNCLFEMDAYDQAETEIKKQLRKNRNDFDLYVQWGYLLKRQNLLDEADKKFDQAVKIVPDNKTDYTRLANDFLVRQEYDYALKVYQQGKRKIPGESFHYELARVYLYERNYELMYDEYLALLKEDENRLGQVESSMSMAFRLDVDHTLRDRFQIALMKRIQADPGVTVYNRLLIWLFLQEKQFASALRQSIALDKRGGDVDALIVRLASIAGNNDDTEEAIKAFDYLIEKGPKNSFYQEAYQGKMSLDYQQFVDAPKKDRHPDELKKQFEKTFDVIGYTPVTTQLIIDYAHFLAFFNHDIPTATSLLQRQMGSGRINNLQRDQLKNELADIDVLKGDLWEAILLYSQIIDANKDNSLGDEVKLKKAKVGYYMGNLKWAQAQLDVLKASTSKLIANDAMELSIFISNNSALDTTAVPMQMFARADLYIFRNQDTLAWLTLDSIETNYSSNDLMDDIYFRKAKAMIKQGNYEKAAGFLQEITTRYSYGLLADDALFMLAELDEKKLNKVDEAEELYKKMLTHYPGSVYVEEARKRYRELRGEVPAQKSQESDPYNPLEIN